MPATKKITKEAIIDAAVDVLRDGGFSAPHVALQKSVHRTRTRKVGVNFVHGVFLPVGELEAESS